MEFWQGFLGLSGLAAVFLLWPTFFSQHRLRSYFGDDERGEANTVVFRDHLKDLEETHSRGEIEVVEFQTLKIDLEKTLVSENAEFRSESELPIVASFRSRLPVIALSVLLPLIALVIYFQIGAYSDWNIYLQSQQLMLEQDPEPEQKKRVQLIENLQSRLESKPDNAQNWYLLAVTATQNGDYEESVRAYRTVLNLQPNSPRIMAELAQALFLRAGNTITPEIREFARQALEQDANMPTALGLAGIDAFQSGRYEEAIRYWQKAVTLLDPRSSGSQVFSNGIASAKAALAQQEPNANGTDKGAGSSASVKVEVSLSKKLFKLAEPPSDSDVVFVYARAWQGPKMPLAIQKITVADLPLKVRLDDSMSMAQGMDLTSFPQVELVARISKNGSAIPQSGDWQATAGPIILADQSKAVSLVIEEQLP